MADSVLNGTTGSLNPYIPKAKPNLQLLRGGDSVSEEQVSYFRHKGIKVKFKDIEDAILAYPHIRAAAVVFSEDREGARRLVAYIIPSGIFSEIAITNFLAEKLKPFMIPVVWVCINKFPLTASGIIDKKALHEPQLHQLAAGNFTAPCNEKEQKLALIIQELLKLERISVNDNFLKLGGSSLQALRVIAAIRKELKVHVDIKYFFIYPTIAELARYLNNLSNITEILYGHPDKEPFVSGSILHHTSIIPIKAGGKRMPLYIVCGGGGTVFTFEKFAHMLDEDQPVYGFQQPSDINEFGQFPNTIEDIAAKYVSEILIINPDGPYALSGHCIGGLIALEMARKLQAMNKKIHLLAMFDVILTKEARHQKSSIKDFLNLISFIKKGSNRILLRIEFETFLLTRHTKHALRYKWKNLKSTVNKVYRFQKEDTDFSAFKKFERKFLKAYANYKLTNFLGNILVFYAKDRYHFLDTDKNIVFKKHVLTEEVKNRWKNYASDVKIFEVDGEHSRMFDPFYSNSLATILQQHLKRQT